MLNRLPALLALVLAAGLIAAGCGGDDEETTTTTTTTEEAGATGSSGATGAVDVSPERAELIEQADTICKEGDAEITDAGEERFGDTKKEPPVAEQEAFLADIVIPNLKGQLEELRALDPPEEDAEQWNTLLDDLEQAIGEVESDPSSVMADDDGPFADVNRDAQDFGLTVCGQG